MAKMDRDLEGFELQTLTILLACPFNGARFSRLPELRTEAKSPQAPARLASSRKPIVAGSTLWRSSSAATHMGIGGNTERRRCRPCINQGHEKKPPPHSRYERGGEYQEMVRQDSFGACGASLSKARARIHTGLDLSPLSQGANSRPDWVGFFLPLAEPRGFRYFFAQSLGMTLPKRANLSSAHFYLSRERRTCDNFRTFKN